MNRCNNKHLMTGSEEKSSFCFSKVSMSPEAEPWIFNKPRCNGGRGSTFAENNAVTL